MSCSADLTRIIPKNLESGIKGESWKIREAEQQPQEKLLTLNQIAQNPVSMNPQTVLSACLRLPYSPLSTQLYHSWLHLPSAGIKGVSLHCPALLLFQTDSILCGPRWPWSFCFTLPSAEMKGVCHHCVSMVDWWLVLPSDLQASFVSQKQNITTVSFYTRNAEFSETVLSPVKQAATPVLVKMQKWLHPLVFDHPL